VAGTCLVAAVCYAGAVTQNALLSGVLSGVLVSAVVVGAQLRRHGIGLAVMSGVAVAFGWAVLVNTFTGDTNGPAARSTLIAGVCTSLAVAAAGSRRPGLFLVPVGGIVFGALALGAGGEVRIVAVLVVVAVVATLAVLEHERRRWRSGGRRTATVALIALLVGAAALVGALVQSHRDARPVRTLDPGAVNATIHPGWSDPLPAAAPVHRVDTRSQHRRVTARAQRPPHHSSHLWLWIGVAALALLTLLLVLVLAVVARLLVVRRRWRRLRDRLRSGEPSAAVAGAWAWARARLVACRLPLPVNASPDLDSSSAALADLPPTVADPLGRLSPHAAVCAFSAEPLVDMEDVARAWCLADEAAAAGFAALTGWGRWRTRYRSPIERPRSGKAAGMSPAVRHG
jgi:hypothetical protein